MLKYDNGIEHHDHQTKAVILFRAFRDRLGSTSETQNLLLLDSLLQHNTDLQELRLLSLRKRYMMLLRICQMIKLLDLMDSMLYSLKHVGILLLLLQQND